MNDPNNFQPLPPHLIPYVFYNQHKWLFSWYSTMVNICGWDCSYLCVGMFRSRIRLWSNENGRHIRDELILTNKSDAINFLMNFLFDESVYSEINRLSISTLKKFKNKTAHCTSRWWYSWWWWWRWYREIP